MSTIEIYEVPAQQLDGTEEFIDEASSLQDAELLRESFVQSGLYSNLWIIQCSDKDGYEKVLKT